MTNTLKNKACFFVLYWGQKVRFWKQNGSGTLQTIGTSTTSVTHIKNGVLLLKSLLSIKDEDALEVSRILISGVVDSLISVEHGRNIALHINAGKGCFHPNRTSHIIDYLRSKGYAVPYMGLSVAKLVEYGWIRLTDYER